MGSMLVYGLLCLLGFIGAIWVWADASDRTDYGCVWALLALFFPVFIIPLYIFMRFYSERPVSRRAAEQYERDRAQFADSRFPKEIDRSPFLKQATRGSGTLYRPADTKAPTGHKHFTDHRAEALIEQARYEEAHDYLADLYAIAQKDNDQRALDTYRYYFTQLPTGKKRQEDWRREKRPQRDAQLKQPRKRDVPF